MIGARPIEVACCRCRVQSHMYNNYVLQDTSKSMALYWTLYRLFLHIICCTNSSINLIYIIISITMYSTNRGNTFPVISYMLMCFSFRMWHLRVACVCNLHDLKRNAYLYKLLLSPMCKTLLQTLVVLYCIIGPYAKAILYRLRLKSIFSFLLHVIQLPTWDPYF